MTINALIFDLDDTLWPVAPVIEHAEQALHRWIAQQVPEVTQRYSIADLRERRQALLSTETRFTYDLWALRHTLLTQVFEEHGAAPEKVEEAMKVFAEERNRVNLYADVLPAFDLFAKDFILGSISNGFADLEAIGLAPYFSISLAAHRFGCAKPDPRIFMAVLAHLKLPASEVMYIGDDLRLDVQAAQQVGMRGVWMNRSQIDIGQTPHHAIKPDLIVADLHELLRKI